MAPPLTSDPLPTVVLHHQHGPDPDHYDWLLTDPNRTDAYLWTARLAIPPHQWHQHTQFLLQPISHHRPHYLTYQGPLTNQRGHITRVAKGSFIPEIWTPPHNPTLIQITFYTPLTHPHTTNRLRLEPHPTSHPFWQATWQPKHD